MGRFAVLHPLLPVAFSCSTDAENVLPFSLAHAPIIRLKMWSPSLVFFDMCLQVMTYNVGLFMAVLVGGEITCFLYRFAFIQKQGRYCGFVDLLRSVDYISSFTYGRVSLNLSYRAGPTTELTLLLHLYVSCRGYWILDMGHSRFARSNAGLPLTRGRPFFVSKLLCTTRKVRRPAGCKLLGRGKYA